MNQYNLDAFSKRLQSTIDTIRGAAVIETRIVVTDGEIVSITRPQITHVEPRNQADQFLRLLTLGTGPARSTDPVQLEKAASFETMITEGEIEAMEYLVKAWNVFTTLPVIHEWDGVEFQHAIHRAQRILLSRPTMRKMATISR